MNCDPNSLIQAATCYRCIPKGMQGQVAIYLLCQWANHLEPAGCGNQGPAWMGTPNLAFVGEFIGIGYPVEIPPPPPFDAGYFVLYWGNTPGGPYPNSLTVPLANAANPFALLPPPLSSNFTTGVFTYFVVRSFDTMDHCSDLSAEVSHIFTAPGAVTPVWTPTTEQVTWTDVNGTFVGDLTTFEHDVAVGSLTNMTFGATGNLTSLSGLQTAPNLAVLDVNTNALTSLDCHGLASLTTLNCSDNASLTTLTLTGCTALVTLDCSICDITGTLNVSPCAASLTTLDCSGNPNLTALNLTGCSVLTTLNCFSCSIAAIDTSPCTSLSYLNCSVNGLITLDLSSNTLLVTLYCQLNNLTALNVTGCAILDALTANNNFLPTIDVSTCVALTYLDLPFNSLVTLNVSFCPLLNYLDCFNNSLTSINVLGCSALLNLQAYNNVLTTGAGGAVNVIPTDMVSSGVPANGLLDLTLQTPLAPPDAGPPNGVAAIATLVGNGWGVTTD